MSEKEEHHRALQENFSRTLLGFWIYLMTDCTLFAVFFATYVVLMNNTFGGPPAKVLFSLPFALKETLLLLVASFFSGPLMLSALKGFKKMTLFCLFLLFVLGSWFLILELTDFSHLIYSGNSWSRSGFLSAFFALVGVHGLHVAGGLLWILFLAVEIGTRGLHEVQIRRLTCLRLFWHFLYIIWIFTFTLVYLTGAL